MKKRLLSIQLALVMMMAMVACGSETESKISPEIQAPLETQTQMESTMPKATDTSPEEKTSVPEGAIVVNGRDEMEALEGTILKSGTVLIADNCAIRVVYDLIMDDVDAAEETVNGWAEANGYVHMSEAQQGEETHIYVTARGGNFVVAAVQSEEGNFRSGVEASTKGENWRYYQKIVLWTVETVTDWKAIEVREVDYYEENGQQYPCYVLTLMFEA